MFYPAFWLPFVWDGAFPWCCIRVFGDAVVWGLSVAAWLLYCPPCCVDGRMKWGMAAQPDRLASCWCLGLANRSAKKVLKV